MAGGAEILETDDSTKASGPGAAATPSPPSVPPPPSSRWGVLRHKHYRNIWLGGFTSNVGGWMEHTGIQWVMTTETLRPEWTQAGYPSALVMLAYLGAAQTVPMLLLSIPAGLVADRVDRKKMLLVTQVILMCTAVVLTTLSYFSMLSPWSLMAIGLATSVTMSFNIPAWQVLTPRLVPRNELTKAITLNGIAFNLARVVGPGLAGFLMSQWNATVLFVINSTSFLAVIGAIAFTPPAPAPPRTDSHVWDQTKEAMRFVFRERGPFRVFLAMVLFSMLAVPLMRMLPVFAAEVYDVATDPLARLFHFDNADLYGVMLSIMGLGAVAGGFAMKIIPSWYPRHHFIPLSVVLGGLSIVGWSLLTDVSLAAIAMFFCGMFWMWAFNSTAAAMQMLVDDRMRGRVLSIGNTAVFGAMPLGGLLAGYIGHYATPDEGVGAQIGTGFLAAVLVVAGLVMLIWRTPEIDGLKPGDPGFERRPGLLRGVTGITHRPAKPPSKPEISA